MDNTSKKTQSKTALKILIPILVVVAIGAVWFAKNGANIGNADPMTPENADANPDFVLEVTEELDIETLKAYGLPIIIDFGADSCVPCKEMAPVLKELNEELRGKAIVKFVDVWKYPQLADGYPIEVIPTQVFFDTEGNPFAPSDPEASQMIMYSLRETNEHVFTTHQGGMTKDMLMAALIEMGMEE